MNGETLARKMLDDGQTMSPNNRDIAFGFMDASEFGQAVAIVLESCLGHKDALDPTLVKEVVEAFGREELGYLVDEYEVTPETDSQTADLDKKLAYAIFQSIGAESFSDRCLDWANNFASAGEWDQAGITFLGEALRKGMLDTVPRALVEQALNRWGSEEMGDLASRIGEQIEIGKL